ncbi:hypothetical protein BOX15_Mlig015875g1, partial [Macrostomum lignano]
SNMTDNLKYIVQELNKEPFNKNLNLITCDSLEPIQLLQILNDVIAEIDERHQMDIRNESADQTFARIIDALRIFRFKPPSDPNHFETFKLGLVQGNKTTVYPILEWLLQKRPELKKRAYLARFLVKINIPAEIAQDEEVENLYIQYEEHIEEFKQVHKNVEAAKSASLPTGDIKKDIKAMQDEKEQLVRRVDRTKKRVQSFPNSASMLQLAQRLRLEKEREAKISRQISDQRTVIQSCQSRAQRLNQQVKDMRQAAAGSTADGLIARLEEEKKINRYMVTEKLPAEIATEKRQVADLQKIASEPAMGQADLEQYRAKMREVNAEINQLIEKKMMAGDVRDDKASLFRQQASIVSRKKAAAAEALREAREELNRAEEELQARRETLEANRGQQGGGEEVLKEAQFREYVAKLRTKSTVYKEKKRLMNELIAENGILTRTLEILRQKEEAVKRQISQAEKRAGVSGYSDTQEQLEKVSKMMTQLNQKKGDTLEDMSRIIGELNKRVNEKKNELAPLIRELRPLREEAKKLQLEYDEKKANYERQSAGVEEKRMKLEQEVKALREECQGEESRYAYMKGMLDILNTQHQRVQDELRAYKSQDPNDKKKPTLRDVFKKKIAEQENIGKSLREKQKAVRDAQQPAMKQVKMWSDLLRLMDCKIACQAKAEVAAEAGEYAGVTSLQENRLVL